MSLGLFSASAAPLDDHLEMGSYHHRSRNVLELFQQKKEKEHQFEDALFGSFAVLLLGEEVPLSVHLPLIFEGVIYSHQKEMVVLEGTSSV